MLIHLSDDGPPLYQQVVEQITNRILSQQLAAGDELPAIRLLAESLRVNPNTIARAYRELEQSGLVEKRRTRGTFVTDVSSSMSATKRREALQPTMDQLLSQAKGLGIDRQQLIKWLCRRDDQLHRPGSKPKPSQPQEPS